MLCLKVYQIILLFNEKAISVSVNINKYNALDIGYSNIRLYYAFNVKTLESYTSPIKKTILNLSNTEIEFLGSF